MPQAGTIFALDLAVHAGYAIGAPGECPRSGSVILKKPDDHRAVAFANLFRFLNERWSEDRPSLVVKEAPLPLQAFKSLGNAAFTVRVTHGLHAVVEGMCAMFGISCEDVSDATVRKHFIGKANCGNRAATKAAIIQRCHLLGYMPKDCCDDNRADALATWDFAAATTPKKLFLFGERAA
jgi:hypothetical protein